MQARPGARPRSLSHHSARPRFAAAPTVPSAPCSSRITGTTCSTAGCRSGAPVVPLDRDAWVSPHQGEAVAPTAVGRLSHVVLDGEGVSLRASICLPSSKRGRASRLFRKIKSRAAIWSGCVWRPGCDLQIFFPIFLSRERWMAPTNSTQLLGAHNWKPPASIVRDAGVDGIIHQPRHRNATPANENAMLDGHVTVLKITIIRTVVDWNGEIAQ
jgi:hypothetical protein